MAELGRVSGYGPSAHATVFAVSFSEALSSKVRYEVYDNNQTFPAVDSVFTTNNDIFGLTAGTSHMLALKDTTVGAPSGSRWFPTDTNPNSASINLMKGVANYVTQHGATLESAGGGTIYFNMQANIPSTAETSSTMGADLLVRYTYTGDSPTVSFWFNNASSGGTFTTPVWTEIVPGSHGIRHTRAGTTTGGPYLANIPSSGKEKTYEAWITD